MRDQERESGSLRENDRVDFRKFERHKMSEKRREKKKLKWEREGSMRLHKIQVKPRGGIRDKGEEVGEKGR